MPVIAQALTARNATQHRHRGLTEPQPQASLGILRTLQCRYCAWAWIPNDVGVFPTQHVKGVFKSGEAARHHHELVPFPASPQAAVGKLTNHIIQRVHDD